MLNYSAGVAELDHKSRISHGPAKFFLVRSWSKFLDYRLKTDSNSFHTNGGASSSILE
uniref:Uncharacterized protein n=1 Tax=Arundo donax TaxID=35708 RepID=A0A0A8XS73_ARUDO